MAVLCLRRLGLDCLGRRVLIYFSRDLDVSVFFTELASAAEILNFEASLLVDGDVFGPQVPVHNSVRVQLAEAEDDLHGEDFRLKLRHLQAVPPLVLDALLQRPSIAMLHYEVEALGRLIEVQHAAEVRMIQVVQQLFLKERRLFVLHDIILAHHLHHEVL